MNEDTEVRIEGEQAVRLAKLFGWPYGEKYGSPVFVIDNEYGELWCQYDSGLDYHQDGHTFEWEWKMTEHEKNLQ